MGLEEESPERCTEVAQQQCVLGQPLGVAWSKLQQLYGAALLGSLGKSLLIVFLAVGQRIIESLRLEKTSKIKSNCQPIITTPAKPCPEVSHLHVF